MNEIWVPSRFNIDTFSNNRVERNKLYAVPEPMDVYSYDPDIVSPLAGFTRTKDFYFLTAMKWEKRKGWDLLIKAYFKEFTIKDKVSLLFLSRVNKEDQEKYQEEVKKICYDVSNPFSAIMRLTTDTAREGL